MNYKPPNLAYATRTSEGIVLNIKLGETYKRMVLPSRQAYHLMLTLMEALERDVR
jgi:hypothetical protein